MPTAMPPTAATSGFSIARQRMEKADGDRFEPAFGALLKIADIAAGAKRARRAGEHDAADRGIGLPASLKRAVIAAYIGCVSAFFFSGRFIRMMRTPPSSVTRTGSDTLASLRSAAGASRHYYRVIIRV